MDATTQPAIVLENLRQMQRAKGPAALLAIGTANPANCLSQDEFTEWYFRVTKSNHLTKLKEKMKRICDRSGIKKRYLHHTEDMIACHPEFVDRSMPSLGARLSICAEAADLLAADAAAKAIAEWGRPAGDITHVVVSTNSGAHEPGVDARVVALLGLRPAVHRTLLCLHGCSAGFVALRVAKDLAENNGAARVLVAFSYPMLLSFSAPEDGHVRSVVSNSIFGDGAGAVIVGADANANATRPIERPMFYLVSTTQVTLPAGEHAVGLHLSESGLDISVSAEVPKLVRHSIEQCVVDALAPLGLLPNASEGGGGGWNSLFWAVQPGGRAILDSVEAALDLEPSKLAASRRVLREYENMTGATIFFSFWMIYAGAKKMLVRRKGSAVCGGSCQGSGLGSQWRHLCCYVPPAAMHDGNS